MIQELWDNSTRGPRYGSFTQKTEVSFFSKIFRTPFPKKSTLVFSQTLLDNSKSLPGTIFPEILGQRRFFQCMVTLGWNNTWTEIWFFENWTTLKIEAFFKPFFGGVLEQSCGFLREPYLGVHVELASQSGLNEKPSLSTCKLFSSILGSNDHKSWDFWQKQWKLAVLVHFWPILGTFWALFGGFFLTDYVVSWGTHILGYTWS